MTAPTTVKPFSIHATDTSLDDLQQRLALTRWPDQIGAPWQYGTDIEYLKQLVNYWRTGFDWRAQETRLNRQPHFLASIDGRQVHFIHARSNHDNALPLLMTHGWPGSVAEFTEIIPMLTDPSAHGGRSEDAFHVVCPSLPGYGFSEPPRTPGCDPKAIALGHIEIMASLGYERYVVQGGDWGSPISTWTARLAPDRVAALHLNLVFAGYPKHKSDPFEGVTADEKQRLEARQQYMRDATGYQAIQGTRPQTLGYGLNDSPVGLAAWITEKFQAWTDCGGEIENAVSRDQLLTNIMIYWLGGNITSSMRLYYESAHERNNAFEHGKILTPTGCATFPAELHQPPRAWVEELYNVRHWSLPPSGGHFAAMEQPELLASDLREFFRTYRSSRD